MSSLPTTMNMTNDAINSTTALEMSDNSTVIGGVIGGILALLIICAIVGVLMVRHRRRLATTMQTPDEIATMPPPRAPSSQMYDPIPRSSSNSATHYISGSGLIPMRTAHSSNSKVYEHGDLN